MKIQKVDPTKKNSNFKKKMHRRKQANLARNYQKQTRFWCLTINHPQRGDCVWNPNTMTYLIAGFERAPQTGTEHIQAYVVFKARKRLSGVKKVFPRAHIEAANGSPVENQVYCGKDGEFEEFGVLPKTRANITASKNKANWELCYNLAKEGRFEEIPKGMLTRYYHAFKRIHQDNPQPVADLTHLDNYWIVAPTGFGKSRFAREKWPDFYDKMPNKWWTGYKGQGTILCDDFGPKQCEYLGWYMKRWADLYPVGIEFKGSGNAAVRPDRVVVTSQYDIRECFEDPLVADAMERRFTTKHLKSWQERRADRAILRAQERLEFRNPTREEAQDEETPDLNSDATATTIEISDDEIDLTQLYGYTEPE